MSIVINSLLYYCRPNYEQDLAAELDETSAHHQLFGYSQLKPKQAYVEFKPYSPLTFSSAEKAKLDIAFDKLIFARQQLLCLATLDFSQTDDRISEVLSSISDLGLSDTLFGDVFCEHAETEDGKQMAKFCKKFSVPLRQALRKNNCLTPKPHNKKAYLHLFFETSQSCRVCISLPNNRSNDYMGISRLKFPTDAPSRSTLKLEEAINKLLPKNSQDIILCKGMTAVDLGACPGGWTFQLVKRGISVEAIDNGEIADALMATGLVKHFAVDGFTYEPIEGHVDWLVCDMIEKPDRVATLMLQWLAKRKTTSTIFNLKLPMQKRYQTVKTQLDMIKLKLKEYDIDAHISVKHLYHDRDEVTVAIIGSMHLMQIRN